MNASDKTPPGLDEKQAAQNPLTKILVLACICVLVLGLSLWGLASAFGTGESSQASQLSSAASNESGSLNLEGDAEGRTQSDAASSSGSAASNAASSSSGESTSEQQAGTTQPPTGTGSGETSGGTGNDASGGANGGAGGSSTPAVSPPASDTPSAPALQTVTVSLSVSCYDAVAAGNATAIAVSDNGAMLYATIKLDAGATVYDALLASGATVGSSSGFLGTYVSSINGLVEKEAGGSSGWKYFVNGVAPSMSCDKYVLSDGDSVEWRFVLQA